MNKKAIEAIEGASGNLRQSVGLSEKDSILVLTKALQGGECNVESLEEWVRERFAPSCVQINKDEYARVCVNALKSIFSLAATDYGSSRQRDMGQLWADVIRGYLGEIAFQKFLKEQWQIEGELGHEEGELGDYLPSDIHLVKFPDGTQRKPNLSISIKTTKWNGIWLDIPGDQFNHSDIHVFIKIGVGRDHLFAFFKEISVFKDKVLKVGKEVGGLSSEEAEEIFEKLPRFNVINAYVCGFIRNNQGFESLTYEGKLGRKHYQVQGWKGPFRKSDLKEIKRIEKVKGEVKFLGIQDFSGDQRYLFNSGNLNWKLEDWNGLVIDNI